MGSERLREAQKRIGPNQAGFRRGRWGRELETKGTPKGSKGGREEAKRERKVK